MASAEATASSSTSSALALTHANGHPPSSSSHPSYSAALNPIDALPYYDRELETQQGLRARVDNEIAQEQKSMQALGQDRLPPPYEPFQSNPHLKAEFDRIAGGQAASQRLDTTRYTLPPPAAGLEASEDEWNQALDNAASQLGHMQIRLKNVELLRKYGSNLWRLHNFQQESMAQQYADAVEAMRGLTNEINRTRQSEQTDAGRKLTSLERRWTELISSGLQLEVANLTAEHEVEALQLQKEALQRQIDDMDRAEAQAA
ncbi:uncharacterized protein PFL1_03528 [Pseudozyma flocculosa PF-1]|uniref:Pre-mRNA-splicing factor SPF27 n=2 Tax=Pseudozyma flocculosa TaxID=84751 RepID=A0A5C3F4S0_9BASI|nr:uncharacterized protein PFL1_03528 [Pseudozyma flocculosa PF-1]EPQ28724.1 hypothetical protein PFL1_03528 [Pseudozyma flocculosa PF-1]SPO39504.1 uncharacterized protein PSFLO_04985 [Pseudozyma flocculosa]